MSYYFPALRGPGPFYGRQRVAGSHLLRRTTGVGVTLTAMGALAFLILYPPAFLVPPPEKSIPTRTEWVDIVRPFQLYSAAAPQFGSEPVKFTARRSPDGKRRADALTYGAELPGATSWLRVEILRGAAEETISEPPLFADIARQAARAGASVSRASLPGVIATRFGRAEIADIQILSGEIFTACMGFRVMSRAAPVKMTGIACGTPAKPLDRSTLACTIDRIDLISSGEDKELGTYFARSEANRRQDCPVARISQPAVRTGWMDASSGGANLKGTLAGTGPLRR